MNNKINSIIDRYKNNEQLYTILKKYYIYSEISQEQYNEYIKEIKNVIVSYYLYKYKFKLYHSNEKQDQLLIQISEICDFGKKVRNIDGKIKIYPVKESNENKEKYYKRIIKQMVDQEIETNTYIEDIFDNYMNFFDDKISEYKQMLKSEKMNLYYGSPYYMIERAKFIAECIKFIPNVSLNVDNLINIMTSFESKYMNNRDSFNKEEDFIVENNQFYEDYDLIESCYKKLLVIENELVPIVIKYWKEYLTDPNKQSDCYRYLTHSFSSGMIDPHLMNKACCSLSTNEIENLMYGSFGLIYDIDVESVDTMCTDDLGSWVITKDEFIDRGCPGKWQLTKLNGQAVFYEYPKNSKLIMPMFFEKECKEQTLNGDSWHYSEIFLNQKARPMGVFYVNECENLEEIEEYAKTYNLPLVNISARAYSNNNKQI